MIARLLILVVLGQFAAGELIAQRRLPTDIPTKLYRSEGLAGGEVFNASRDEIGEIHDVVIDAATGAITHAIISAGGFLGIGDRHVAVPWKLLQDEGHHVPGFVTDLTLERLRRSPPFKADGNRAQLIAELASSNRRFGRTATAAPRLPFLATRLPGAVARSSDGRGEASIHDLILDVHAGRVLHVIVEVTLESRSFLAPVPWKLIEAEVPPAGQVWFRTNTPAGMLDSHVAFSSTNWPSFDNFSWNNGVWTHYHVEPVWTRDDLVY